MSPFRKKNSALKISKGEKTRRRLLESAVKSFTLRGYENASFTDLAEDAKVNRALFNHYFGSKDKLIVECLHHVFDEGREQVQSHVEASPAEQSSVERYFRANFEGLREKRHHFAYIIQSLHRAAYDPAMRNAVDERFASAWSRIAEWMREDPSLEVVAVPDLLDLARELHMILLGGVMMALADAEGDSAGHERRCLAAARDILAAYQRNSGLAAPP